MENITAKQKPQEKTEVAEISGLFKAALVEGNSVALWRPAGKQEQHLVVDLSGGALAVHPEVEELPEGFLFTPYEADFTQPEARVANQSLFLHAHLYFSSAELKAKISSELDSPMREKAENLLKSASTTKDQEKGILPYHIGSSVNFSATKTSRYLELVSDAIKEIQEGRVQKLVCGRAKKLPLADDFNPLIYFNSLCSAYPDAFVSFVSVPGAGSWIGASPEVLIQIDSNQVFRTMALAGTQAAAPGQKLTEAVWRQKEIEEQALVSRYVINCFKKIRLRDFEECGPRTIAAGNLMHLRTDFSVDIPTSNFPHLGTTMLELLHPTSAVCGMPRAEAKAFLQGRENLDRQFFAGFLGPVNIKDETSLYVNLRCMQLLEKEVILYAGAGITGDSEPEKEWQETEHKINTLASLL